MFRNRLAEGSPYPKLQSNTSSHVQSDEDNNYLWNWVAPLVRRLGQDPGKYLERLRHLQLHRAARRAYLEPRSGGHPPRWPPQPDEDVKGCYFFVTDLSGHYYYARTYAEHQATAKKQRR